MPPRAARRRSTTRPGWVRLVLQAASIAGALGTLATGWWLFDGQYERRTDADAHAHADSIGSLYTRKGMAELRQSFLDDKVQDLMNKKLDRRAFTAGDGLSLERYQRQFDAASARVNDLQRQIDEATKPKAR